MSDKQAISSTALVAGCALVGACLLWLNGAPFLTGAGMFLLPVAWFIGTRLEDWLGLGRDE